MLQKIKLNYFNSRLNIGLQDVKHVYLLNKESTVLFPEVYRGKLVYRAKGSNRRISYDQIKKGLVKRTFWIRVEVPEWYLP
jgi:hypothetical protein